MVSVPQLALTAVFSCLLMQDLGASGDGSCNSVLETPMETWIGFPVSSFSLSPIQSASDLGNEAECASAFSLPLKLNIKNIFSVKLLMMNKNTQLFVCFTS